MYNYIYIIPSIEAQHALFLLCSPLRLAHMKSVVKGGPFYSVSVS